MRLYSRHYLHFETLGEPMIAGYVRDVYISHSVLVLIYIYIYIWLMYFTIPLKQVVIRLLVIFGHICFISL